MTKPLIYKGFGEWRVVNSLGSQGEFPTWSSALLHALRLAEGKAYYKADYALGVGTWQEGMPRSGGIFK